MVNIFPGTRLLENFDELREEILLQINPKKLNSMDNLKNWKRIDNELYSVGGLGEYDNFYILYKHPIHPYLDKLFETNYQDLIEFLQDRIDPEKEEGMDLIIASRGFEKIIVCNHDGQIYHVK